MSAGSDKRKDQRQPLRYPAQIDLGDGSPLKACLISNVSASGAKVTVDNPDQFPDRLYLILARDQGTRRHCNVVWRAPDSLGLEFVKAPPPKAPPTFTSVMKNAARQG